MSQSMWQLFVAGLAQTGILAVDPATFKPASGLAIADWEIDNYTGIGPTAGLGTPIPANVFKWADPMPDETGKFYQPGPSLSDSYATFLDSLSVSGADAATIARARSLMAQFQMADGSGNRWPGYGITPGLNDFLLASLQSVARGLPPQIDFSVPAPASAEVTATTRTLRGAQGSRPASADPPFFGIDRQPMMEFQPASAPPRPLEALALKSNANATGGGDASTIRFQAQAAQMFYIQPYRWFSANIVGLFHDRIDPASALANKPVFGPGGFLNGRASQILVAFKRVVTVNGQASAIARMHNDVQQAKTIFNLGSFHFDPSQTDIETTAPGTLLFQDNTNAPSVIGVAVELFAG